MQSGKDGNIPRNIGIEDLVHIIRVKESDISSYKYQIEQLQLKLSEYIQKEESLPDKQASHRTPLSRAKSDPVPGQARKNSNAEIFLFPPNGQSSQKQISPPLSHVVMGTGPANNAQSSTFSNKAGTEYELETSLDLRSNIPSSWLDPNMASQGCTGVSEVYFKNVLNELVKTKKYLNNLLMQKHSPDKTVELNNLRQEVQQLMFTKQHLERELDVVKDENTQLKKTRSPIRNACQDNAVLEDVTKWSQTDHHIDTSQVSVQMLTSELRKLSVEKQNMQRDLEFTIRNLMTENDKMKKELEELQISHKNLSTQVVSISTLLQEERKKCKSSEESLHNKTIEAKELSQKLCILRQKYEELMGEKNALEKNLALAGSIGRHRGHQPGTKPRISSHDKYQQHTAVHGESPKHSYSGGQVHSLGTKGTSPAWTLPQPKSIPRDQHDTSAADSPLNNLSPREPDERKPLNIVGDESLPRYNSEYECPNCLQNFVTENLYHLHMSKCIE